MLFNSYVFILAFLPISLCVYYALNKLNMHTLALVSLIMMSFVFYTYNIPQYGVLFAFSILVNYIIVRFINYNIERKSKNVFLFLGILFNLILIFYFKYYDFVIENLNNITGTSWNLQNIILPLGISFYTFQQISYLVDSVRGETKSYNFIEYAAFVSFFPQLVAGPIVLHSEIIPQFRDQNKKRFNQENFARGIYNFSVGLFKKVLIADTFGKAVEYGFAHTDILSSSEIIVVMLSYTFQIYFDFSGYCDMANGIAKMYNIELPINFNSPYKSFSITEFWKRWHMTLTRFLRQYVYFPLGGGHVCSARKYFNIFIVFFASGLWHGANWTFIVWGLMHGVANILNRIFEKTWSTFHKALQWTLTFIFINVTWLIFRADSLHQAFDLLQKCVAFKTFEICEDLRSCFYMDSELQLFLKIDSSVGGHIYAIQNYIWTHYYSSGIGMILFLLIAFIVCINTKNLYDSKFVPSVKKMIAAVIMLVWSIVSLEGVSTFLYFNF